MTRPFDPDSPRQPTQLDVNSELERTLAAALKQRRRERWLDENRPAIAAYNRHVDRHGTFSDGLRSF